MLYYRWAERLQGLIALLMGLNRKNTLLFDIIPCLLEDSSMQTACTLPAQQDVRTMPVRGTVSQKALRKAKKGWRWRSNHSHSQWCSTKNNSWREKTSPAESFWGRILHLRPASPKAEVQERPLMASRGEEGTDCSQKFWRTEVSSLLFNFQVRGQLREGSQYEVLQGN